MKARVVNPQGEVTIPEPPLAHVLFSTTRFAWLWAIVRIYLGYEWAAAGWHKISSTGWLDGGSALKGFWTKAAAIPAAPAKPAITYDTPDASTDELARSVREARRDQAP